MSRVFEDKPATREQTPCLIGIVGPSGTGKTWSGLRLATGMQRVSGGDIGVIDTEGRRALHYSESFKFRHIAFGAPFGSLDYLDAIKHFVSKGVKTIIVDSFSHEHEGPGGLLEQHAAETTRLSKQWNQPEFKTQLSAWAKPKADRRRMINEILQLNMNLILCFRAKEKLRIVPGKDPVNRGYIAITAEEIIFELLMSYLLLPGAVGRPAWKSEYEDERAIMKMPEQFRDLFKDGPQLSEDIGQALAQWSAGAKPISKKDKLLQHFAGFGVSEAQLVAHLGHAVEDMTDEERAVLGPITKAIKAGTTTWEAATTKDASK
jgi:ABC-type dipeptide/oligopeptide/nickel transport system ATPase subunit